jgi:hypothetical protein
MQTYTLRQAAELCGVTLTAMRRRADRGTVRTLQQDGIRRVPHSELERAGLLPDAEVRALKAENGKLRKELTEFRQLVQSTQRQRESEQEARERAERTLHEQHAVTLEATTKFQQLEDSLANAGPLRAWKIARSRLKTTTGAAEHQ